MKVHTNELKKMLAKHPEVMANIGLFLDENGTPELIIPEMGGLTTDLYARRGLEIEWLTTDDQIITYDPTRFSEVRTISMLVTDSYENDDLSFIWDALELGGDDQVDYAGSHVDILIDTLEAYEAHK